MNQSITLLPGSSVQVGRRLTAVLPGATSFDLSTDVTIYGADNGQFIGKILSQKEHIFAYLQNIHFVHSCNPEMHNWSSARAFLVKTLSTPFNDLSTVTLIDFVASAQAVPPKPPVNHGQETPEELAADAVNGESR